MYKFLRVFGLVLITGLFLSTAQAEGNAIRKYRLPDHGMLELSVPESWAEEVRQPPFGLPPTIILRPEEKDDFVIMITPLWTPNGDETSNLVDNIKELMEAETQAAKARAVEKELVLKPIGGTATCGYYYGATDKTPEPEGWEYMVRAGVACGELLISGTFLTHDKSSPAMSAALDILKTAKQTREETLRSTGN